MLMTKKLLREYLKKILNESLVTNVTINVGGKDYLIINDLEHMEMMTQLLIQSQAGTGTSFGNYFEEIVLDAFPQYAELNDAGNKSFPFADVYDDQPGYNTMYSVKVKSYLDDNKLGGGAIRFDQIRSMLQHPTTVSSFDGKNLKLGLISGALEAGDFDKINQLGLPIKIVFVNPTDSSPTFKYNSDPKAIPNISGNAAKVVNQGILGVKYDNLIYNQKCLGNGLNNQDYKFSTLTLDDTDGFYKINGSDSVFKIDMSDNRIVNDAQAIEIETSVDNFIQDLEISQIPDLATYQAMMDSKDKKIKAQIPILINKFNLASIDMFLNQAARSRKATAKKLEEPNRPSISGPSSIEVFNELIMDNTGKIEAPIYMIITGGFATQADIQAVLNKTKNVPSNILSLVKKVRGVLDVQASTAVGKGGSAFKTIVSRINKAFSPQDLIQKVISIDKVNFPNGFYLEIIKDTKGADQIYYRTPAALKHPKGLLDLFPTPGIYDAYYDYYVKKNPPYQIQMAAYNKYNAAEAAAPGSGYSTLTPAERKSLKMTKKKPTPTMPVLKLSPNIKRFTPAEIDQVIKQALSLDPNAFDDKKFKHPGEIFTGLKKQAAGDKAALANKVILKIAVEIFLGAFNEIDIPMLPNASQADIDAFKKALSEFTALKAVSEKSKSEAVMTKQQLDEIDQNIKDFRQQVVIPAANKVIPQSGTLPGSGAAYTRDSILKKLGVINEFLDKTIGKSLQVFPSMTDVIITIYNLASLLDDIIQLAQYDIKTITSALEGNIINESKVYEKILLELLSYSK